MTDLPAPPAARPPRRSGAGQWIALGCALLLLLGAGGGLARLALGHRDDAPAPWSAPARKHEGSYGAVSGGAHYGALTKLLLPVPHGWRRGPDLAQYGDDTTIGSARAQDLTVRSIAAGAGRLTSAERRELTNAVKKLHIKGIGLRSYQDAGSTAVAQITLEQADTHYSRTSEHNLVALLDAFADKGPKVPGHSEAHCYADWSAGHGRLRETYCTAGEGDLVADITLQTLRGSGTTRALTLVAHQLDRIADPGESV